MEQINFPEKYYKEITRINESLFSIKAWYEGESRELKKLLGIGLFNTLFVSSENTISIYYDSEEAENFHEKLKEVLTDDFFDKLCEEFFDLINESDNFNTNEEIYGLLVRCFPALVIFDEISKYPEIATDNIVRRLERVRKNTEAFSYDLMKKVNSINEPKNYIYFQGDLYVKKLNDI
ncbi:MAG: hypothetical protein IIA85_00800 [Nanoarchaeota archaeon]|nr:hypothetical protein [Nanoarchaeota archaeon]